MKTVQTMPNGTEHGTSAVTLTYPISMLLDRLIYDHGQSPAEFVKSLGYGEVAHGGQQLKPWLASGDGPAEFIDRVAAIYPSVQNELRLAVAATIHIKGLEAAGAGA